MRIDWVKKLTSRKWWLAVATFIVGCLMLTGDANTAEKIGALIMLGADVCGYTLAEGLADAGATLKD